MADIQPYARILYLRKMPRNAAMPETYIRRDEVIATIAGTVRTQMAEFGAETMVDADRTAESLFVEMVAASAFSTISDEFAGDYYCVVGNNMQAFRSSAISGDRINNRADLIGENRYFSDVFLAWKSGNTELPQIEGLSFEIPASDRLVTINHNQQAEVEASLDALIEDVRSDNEPLEGGVKQRLLGQLRAGHELIRAGSFRAYILYHTLVRGLVELAARYRGRAIAIAAEKLIELIVQSIFEGSF